MLMLVNNKHVTAINWLRVYIKAFDENEYYFETKAARNYMSTKSIQTAF